MTTVRSARWKCDGRMTFDKTANSQITTHFNSTEFICKCKNKSCATTEIDPALVTTLQRIRDHFGTEVTINSAYRCKKHNAAVGGAKDSFHMQGRAADIKVSGVKPKTVAQYAESIGVNGIGLYDNFVHVDTRTRRFLWKGSTQKEVSTFGPYEGSDTMAVKIGHASIDERGKISGGKAGDQNGKEVFTRNWYKHSKEWYTVIPTDPEMLEYIAEAMEHACANPDIGYDQNSNRTLWNNVKPYGYDPAKTTKAVETDCAELAALCAQYALAKTGKNVVVKDSYSADLADNLVKTGYFKKLTADKYTNQDDFLLRGSIQTTRTKGHVWVILTNGKKASLAEFYGVSAANPEKVEADTAPTVPETLAKPSESGYVVKVTGESVNIRSGPGTKYTAIDQVNKGDVLEVPDASGWTPVKYGGHVYWISEKYSDMVKE